jgi:hypothetical protein
MANPAFPEHVDDPGVLNGPSLTVLVHLAEVLGKCRLFEVDVDPTLDGTLTLGMALAVQRLANQEAQQIIDDFVALRLRRDKTQANVEDDDKVACQLEYDEAAIQIVERRFTLVVVHEALMEAFYASVGEDIELVDQMRQEMDRYLDTRDNLDSALSQHMHVLLPVRRTRLLDNWFTSLRPEVREIAAHWWFFDENRWLEAEDKASLLHASEMREPHHAPDPASEESDVLAGVIRGTWSDNYSEAACRELALAADSDELSEAFCRQFDRSCKCVLPDGTPLSVTIQLDAHRQFLLTLEGPSKLVATVVSLRLGPHPGAVTDPSLPFRWVIEVKPLADRSSLKALKDAPLEIGCSNGTTIVISSGGTTST